MIEIIELFKQKINEIPEGFNLDYPQNVTDFKQIRYKDWPASLQYQFLERSNYIGVEIHLESEKLKPLADILKPYVDIIKDLDEFDKAKYVYWDPLWFLSQKTGGAGRLVIEFSKTTSSAIIVNAMIDLINITFDDINDNLLDNEADSSNEISRDKTKYRFNDIIYNKNRLVLEVVKQYIKDNPDITFQGLEEAFPKSLQGSYGVFKTKDEAIKKRNESIRTEKRYFLESNEILKTSNQEIAVCTQWGKGNIENFVDKARELGYQIEEIKSANEIISTERNIQAKRNRILDALVDYYKTYLPEGYLTFRDNSHNRCWRGVGKNGKGIPEPYYVFIYFNNTKKFHVEMQIPQDKVDKFNSQIISLRIDLSNVYSKAITLNNTRIQGNYKAIEIELEPDINQLSQLDFDSAEFKAFCRKSTKAMNALIEKTQFIFDQDEKEEEIIMPVNTSIASLPPLNVILYGPPGTGKTYNSINYAVSIIEGKSLKDLEDESRTNRAEVEKRFNEYREAGQLEFITFHQSYSYEDFIQGLKPDTDGEGQLSFNRKDGLFKIIAERAMKGGNFDEVYEKFKDDIDGMPNGVLNLKTKTHSKDFSIRINSRGSCTIVPSTQKATEMTLTKPVIKEYLLNGKKLDWPSYLVPVCDYIKEKYNPVMTDENNKNKNFVIIIDEINRANISRVFGELITLIEPDKRETLKVTLPSGETFSVPKNLYIVGTMNTADKSIALLDIALRRRFKFIGKYPDYSLIPAFKDYLKPINEEIKKRKKSSDFMIGHSYFINKNKSEFSDIFNNEIIPLLNEYFNNKTETVEEILKTANIQYQIDEYSFQIVVKEQA